jgi:SagB-type dehydrogenase family enzyme
MRKSLLLFLGIALVMLIFGGLMFTRFKRGTPDSTASPGDRIKLPEPVYESDFPVEQALLQRQSVRDYTDRPLTLAEVSQLLWAAQGITRSGGKRTAPSAGALYPLEVYLVVGEVDGLASGVYKYLPGDHELVRVGEGDRRADLSTAALSQESIEEAPAAIVITAIYERTTIKYGERGIRYVHMEVGSAAQNIYLQAVSLDLGTVFIGAFHDQDVKRVLNLPDDEEPLCIMPVGRIK